MALNAALARASHTLQLKPEMLERVETLKSTLLDDPFQAHVLSAAILLIAHYQSTSNGLTKVDQLMKATGARDIFAVLDKAVDINLKSVKDDALQRDLTRLQSSVRTSAQVYDKLDRILNRTFSFQLPSDLYDISWVLFLSYREHAMESRGSVPEHDFSASLKQMIAAALICLFNYEEDMEDISVQEFLDKHHISVHPVSIVEEATSIGKFLQELVDKKSIKGDFAIPSSPGTSLSDRRLNSDADSDGDNDEKSQSGHQPSAPSGGPETDRNGKPRTSSEVSYSESDAKDEASTTGTASPLTFISPMYFDDNYDGLTQVYLEHLHKYRLAVDERLFRNFMIYDQRSVRDSHLMSAQVKGVRAAARAALASPMRSPQSEVRKMRRTEIFVREGQSTVSLPVPMVVPFHPSTEWFMHHTASPAHGTPKSSSQPEPTPIRSTWEVNNWVKRPAGIPKGLRELCENYDQGALQRIEQLMQNSLVPLMRGLGGSTPANAEEDAASTVQADTTGRDAEDATLVRPLPRSMSAPPGSSPIQYAGGDVSPRTGVLIEQIKQRVHSLFFSALTCIVQTEEAAEVRKLGKDPMATAGQDDEGALTATSRATAPRSPSFHKSARAESKPLQPSARPTDIGPDPLPYSPAMNSFLSPEQSKAIWEHILERFLSKDSFLRGLTFVATEAVLYSQNLDSLQYPRLLELMKVDPWDVWRAIAPFMRVESTMPSALSRHLFYVEEQLLLEGGWKEHTLFVASLRDLASKIKAKEATMSEEERKVRGDVTLQDVMPIPVSVAMFLRKVAKLAAPRFEWICHAVGLEEIGSEAWTAFTYILQRPALMVELLQGRHILVPLICCIYCVNKAISKKSLKFSQFVNPCYQLDPCLSREIFSCTFVKKEGEEQVFGTMVAYYNQTFLPAMGTMVMNMASKRLSGEKMDAPLPPTRTPPTQEQAPHSLAAVQMSPLPRSRMPIAAVHIPSSRIYVSVHENEHKMMSPGTRAMYAFGEITPLRSALMMINEAVNRRPSASGPPTPLRRRETSMDESDSLPGGVAQGRKRRKVELPPPRTNGDSASGAMPTPAAAGPTASPTAAEGPPSNASQSPAHPDVPSRTELSTLLMKRHASRRITDE